MLKVLKNPSGPIYPPFNINHAMIEIMKNLRERILVVENDPETSDLISRQTLKSIGYRVEVARTATAALQETARFQPDVILANLNLPGISGKDLLVALSSQGIETPVIVIAEKGMEGDVIQAFRLGAADYLLWPVREAEVVSAVERVLRQVRDRRDREAVASQLKLGNEELQRRVRGLATALAIGKAVTAANTRQPLVKLVEGSVYLTEADRGLLFECEGPDDHLILRAQHNLPAGLAGQVGQPWDDDLGTLVVKSAEALVVNGKPLERFKIGRLGKSVLAVPVKEKRRVTGLLVVIRAASSPFSTEQRTLLEAMADYAAIAMTNTRLLHAWKAQVAQVHAGQAQDKTGSTLAREMTENITANQENLQSSLLEAISTVNTLLVGESARLNAAQKGVLRSAEQKLREVLGLIDASQTSKQKT